MGWSDGWSICSSRQMSHHLANGGSSLLVSADDGPMQSLTRSPSLPLQSGFTLCPLGRFTGLLGQALFLLGPELFAFGCFARQPLGGQQRAPAGDRAVSLTVHVA